MEKEYILPEAVDGATLKALRKHLHMDQKELSVLLGVSETTLEHWETENSMIQGPVVLLTKLLWENPAIPEKITVPKKTMPLRLWYMYRQIVCTVIDVDEINQQVKIYNYTDKLQYRAFGKIEEPTFYQYKEFLEERCFPRGRADQKVILEELGLPFYDPFMIIEKTKGRMAEDAFWIRIER